MPLSTWPWVPPTSSGAEPMYKTIGGKMSEIKISASARNENGKGASRRARRAGLIPGVIYGHGMDTKSVLLPGHELFLIVKDNSNAVINLEVEGEKYLVLLKEVQRHPVRRDILHVDLQAVNRNEMVDVVVAITVVGEAAPKSMINQEFFELPIAASPLNIPEMIEISVEGLEVGTTIKPADLVLPEGVTCTLEEDIDIIIIAEEERMDLESSAEGEENSTQTTTEEESTKAAE